MTAHPYIGNFEVHPLARRSSMKASIADVALTIALGLNHNPRPDRRRVPPFKHQLVLA
jgi:hypothetical protein